MIRSFGLALLLACGAVAASVRAYTPQDPTPPAPDPVPEQGTDEPSSGDPPDDAVGDVAGDPVEETAGAQDTAGATPAPQDAQTGGDDSKPAEEPDGAGMQTPEGKPPEVPSEQTAGDDASAVPPDTAGDVAGETQAAEGAAIDSGERVPTAIPTRTRFDFIRGASYEAVVGELTRLARLEPDRLKIRPYGTSRDGRELLVATLGEEAETSPAERPSLFLVADLDTIGANGPAPPTAGLFVVSELMARAKGEERVRNLLRKADVHIVLLPDPDTLASAGRATSDVRPASSAVQDGDASRDATGDSAGSSTGSSVAGSGQDADARRAAAWAVRTPRAELNSNFPEGWTPFAAPGSDGHPGPYPLCEPESLALARYLLDEASVRGSIVWTRRAGGVGGCEANGYVDGALQRLGLGPAEADGVCARSGLIDEPGSLARFCRAALDGPVLFAPAWEGPELETVLGPAPAGFVRLVDLVVAMLEELPRLEIGEPKVERLRADLWQIDVELWRGGALAGAQPMIHEPAPITGLGVSCDGGMVHVVALRRNADGAFVPLPTGGSDVALGELRAADTLVLRLVVAAPEKGEIAITLDSSMTSPRELRVTLP